MVEQPGGTHDDLARTMAIYDVEVRRRGGIYSQIEDHVLVTQLPDRSQRLVVSLTNLVKARKSGQLADGAIRTAIAALLDAPDREPSWTAARSELRWSLEGADLEAGDAYGAAVTRQLRRLLVRIDTEEALVRYVSRADVEAWPATEEDVEAVAGRNLDSLLSTAQVNVETVDGQALAWFDTPTVSKASLLLAPSLKDAVRDILGWPVLATAPARDFVYLLGEESQDVILPRLGAVVARELTTSPYPLSGEVLRIGDEGITAIGAFSS